MTQLVKCENLKPPQSVNFATKMASPTTKTKDKKDKGQRTNGKDKARTRQRWAGERVTIC